VWALLNEDIRLTQPHPAAAYRAGIAFVDEFHTGSLDCGDQLHKGIHSAPDYAFTAFHALDRRHRQARRVRQGALIHAKQSSRRP